MSNGKSPCFYRLDGFIFRPDKVVHVELEHDPGPPERFGLLLWFTHQLHPDRRINNGTLRRGTIIWFDDEKERHYQLDQLSGVRHGSVPM